MGAALPVSLSGYCGILCCSGAFYLVVDIMKGWGQAPDNSPVLIGVLLGADFMVGYVIRAEKQEKL